MSGKYILRVDGEQPVPVASVLLWGRWMTWAQMDESSGWNVGDDTIVDAAGNKVRVSTKFLGLDHRHDRFINPHGSPILWETMIFGGPHDEWQERYTSAAAARAGHAKALRIARGEEEPD